MSGFGYSDWSYDSFEKLVIFPPDPLFLTLRTNDIVHFATYLLSKIVLYIIYVIICTYMGIN